MGDYKLCEVRLGTGIEEVLVSDMVKHQESKTYQNAVQVLKRCCALTVRELQSRIRRYNATPNRGYNKYGLAWQLTELRFGQEIMRVLSHYINLHRKYPRKLMRR